MRKIGLLMALLLVLTACSDNKGNTVDTKEEVLETTVETKEEVLETNETSLENIDTALENNKEVSGLDKTVLEYSEEGMKTTITYYANGDDVFKQEVVNVVDKNYLSITEEEIKAQLENTQNTYNNIKGTMYEYNMDEEEKITEKILVDFKNLDIEAYKKLNPDNIEGDLSNGVSLKKSIELLKELGFVEVKE